MNMSVDEFLIRLIAGEDLKTIDCDSRVARIRARIYNVWSVESVFRNPITMEPILSGPNRIHVHLVIEIDQSRPLASPSAR